MQLTSAAELVLNYLSCYGKWEMAVPFSKRAIGMDGETFFSHPTSSLQVLTYYLKYGCGSGAAS
jgi:hypothetical protein